ncbi:NAD-dependent epimerase/dehydratase family protein [Vallitalea maricola]|uniref:Uncharacterized protein n=1 Tax=Vallitalea maricola TaxID=3074433 RepID=A0ACB5UFZ0_9FIRM|nr:hypothetical protein AN2V17_07390 [Vallitalea sp. AN17-2]
MLKGLIGHTGLVGSNLDRQAFFHEKYNSKNIDSIRGKKFDLLVCAGMYGTKWYANKYPQEDKLAIYRLLDNLETVSCGYFVLISTVDVYKNPNGVDEDTIISTHDLHDYGKNRYEVEQIIKARFSQHSIIRLPALFGKNLKKNYIYDLMNNHCLEWTHRDSVYQYYNLDYLWDDIKIVMDNHIPLINFNSEPIKAWEIASECFNRDFTNVTKRLPDIYDVKSKYSYLFSKDNYYMYSRQKVLRDIINFSSISVKVK